MKFTADTNELIARLNVLAKVQKKALNTTLSNIKMTVADSKLMLVSNDNDMEVRTMMYVTDVENGSVMVNTDTFTSMIRNVPNQNITFTCDEKDYKIIIKYANGKFKMVGNDAKEFISVGLENDRSKGFNLDNEELTNALDKTKTCVAEKDILRPIMCGIYVDITSDDISVVSTDSHSLMHYSARNIGTQQLQPTSFTIPIKAADVLSSIIAQKPDSNTTIYVNDNNAEIVSDFYILKTRLLDGRFPNYKMVLPKNNDKDITFNRKNLIAALKRVSNFASNASNLIKIVGVKDKCFYLSSENLDFELSAKEMIEDSTIPTEDFVIGFNAVMMLNIINSFNGDTITFHLKSSESPALITSDTENNAEAVLMPLRIENI